MKVFSVSIRKDLEFAVVGVANVAKGTAKFQGTMNGIPFVQHVDYQKVREFVMKSVAMNQPKTNLEAS